MKNSASDNEEKKQTNPITHGEEIQKHQDNKIDEDFKNYVPGKEKLINPKTPADKKTADLDAKDGEKMTKDEQQSDGSGGAFESTEEV